MLGVAERGEGTVPARFQFRNDGVGVSLHRGADSLSRDMLNIWRWISPRGSRIRPRTGKRCSMFLGDDGKDYIYGAQHVRRRRSGTGRRADAHAVQFSRFHGKILVVG